MGPLFWVIERTSSAKDANLQPEIMTASQTIKLHMPGPAKKRKLLQDTLVGESFEMPGVPILTNPKMIPKKTKLVAFQAMPPKSK